MADSTLRSLAGSLVAAAIGLALLAGTAWLASGWLDERRAAFDRARRELASAARQYRSASDDQAVYRQYADRFRTMSERGWIGADEGRLSWIEALQSINADLKLPVLRYEIGQREAAATAGGGSARMQLYRTPMTLRIGALHEYDVVELLRRLDHRGNGLLSLSGCTFTGSGPVRLDARAANVEASCTLDWYTLQLDTEE